MKFEDSIPIKASCEEVYSFFEEMDRNYLLWHSEHRKFEWRKGRGLGVGNVFFFEEEIGGQVLRKETRFTKIQQNRYIEFEMVNWFFRLFIPKMTFVFAPQQDFCQFTAQVFLRGVGPIGKWANRREFEAVRKHMKEEGENLKHIIESK